MTRGLERGDITEMVRPRAQVDEVQRLLLVLSPDRRRRFRVIVVGRRRPDRFWGFVDVVLDSAQDLRAVLGAQTCVMRNGAVRHIPAAIPIASGRYELTWVDGHARLRYDLGGKTAEYVVTVANPDPAAWGLSDPPSLQSELFDETEVHVTVPAPMPPSLQQRLHDRPTAPLDSVEFLDCPGAELIFIYPASETTLAGAA